MTVARRFTLSGRVQGVGFRYFAYRAARQLGVTGSVRNLSDGRVEILAQGDEPAMQQFLAEVRRGPSLSVVRDLDIETVVPADWMDFRIED